ncbi:DUF11 domain-containing protein [Myxococcota bacterium]|nr:DUF11 domain-containing protein [Myxococcota bacterium]
MKLYALALASSFIGSSAFAAADLSVALTPPAGVHVYDLGRYDVSVSNVGNRDATAVSLTIQLPTTNTSPQVYVMGTLGAKSAACAQSGTRLVCSLGTVRRNRSTAVFFELALPQASTALTVSASATTTAQETNLANNAASVAVDPVNDPLTITPPRAAIARHCTGTGLTSFYECTLFPSSISQFDLVFEAGAVLTFPGQDPAYTGSWSQPTSAQLSFLVYEAGLPAAEFSGWAVDASCFEGLTTFPGSTYVSPYEVCLQ